MNIIHIEMEWKISKPPLGQSGTQKGPIGQLVEFLCSRGHAWSAPILHFGSQEYLKKKFGVLIAGATPIAGFSWTIRCLSDFCTQFGSYFAAIHPWRCASCPVATHQQDVHHFLGNRVLLPDFPRRKSRQSRPWRDDWDYDYPRTWRSSG